MRGDEPFDEKATASPELGTRYPGVEHGHVATVDPETDDGDVLGAVVVARKHTART